MEDVEAAINEVMANCRDIAVFGMSRDPGKSAHSVPMFLRSKGYNIIPVNPSAMEIAGMRAYPNLLSVPGRIDLVEVFRPSAEAKDVVLQAIERREQRGDVKAVWLQQGIVSGEAMELAEGAGLIFIQDRCMALEYDLKMKR